MEDLLDGDDLKQMLNVTQTSDDERKRELADQYKSMGALFEDAENLGSAEQYKAMLDEKARTVGETRTVTTKPDSNQTSPKAVPKKINSKLLKEFMKSDKIKLK